MAAIGYCAGTRAVLAAAEQIPNLRGALLLSGPILDGTHDDYVIGAMTTTDVTKMVSRRSMGQLLTSPAHRRRALRVATAKSRGLWNGRVAVSLRRRRPAYASMQVIDPLRRLVARGVPIGFAYGTGDDFYPEFLRAKNKGALGPLLEQAGGRAMVHIADGRAHGFPTLQIQEAIMDTVTSWMDSLAVAGNPD